MVRPLYVPVCMHSPNPTISVQVKKLLVKIIKACKTNEMLIKLKHQQTYRMKNVEEPTTSGKLEVSSYLVHTSA